VAHKVLAYLTYEVPQVRVKSFTERTWKSRPVPEGCTRYLLCLKVPTEYKIFYVLIYQSTPSELTRVGNKADSQELVRKCESETFASRGRTSGSGAACRQYR